MQKDSVQIPINPPAKVRRPPKPGGLEPGSTDAEALARLKSERVQQRLAKLPDWRLSHGGTAIQRIHRFPLSRVAMAYAAFTSELATSFNMPVHLSLRGSSLFITLHGAPIRGSHGGVTDAMLDFAEVLR